MSMARLDEALLPVLEVVRAIDPGSPSAASALEARLPVEGPALRALAALVRQGVEDGWLAERETGGLRFGRVRKASGPDDVSVEVVHMAAAGPGHTHPRGEIDLCFAVSATPRFDGRAQGWTVYGPGSWHVPTVEGGAMDILYFLPGGEIRFEPRPSGRPQAARGATGG